MRRALLVLLALAPAAAYPQADSLTQRVRAAVQQYQRGDREGAQREFARFIDIYNASAARLTSRDLVAVAIACTYLGARDPQLYRDAMRAYDQAIARDPDNLDARVRLGELFLDKYNSAEARRALAAALQRNAAYVPALLAEARRRAFDGERGADSLAARALSLEPDNIAARVLSARFRADAEDYAGARREIDRAVSAAPADAGALAFDAALKRVTGDSAGYARVAARYAELFPRDAGAQVAAAELLARVRQYSAAAATAREGVRRDSSSWKAHALLGNNLLRLGDVAAAKRSLEAAFAGDPFDVWTKNTLDLLDTFTNYDEVRTDRFRLVIEKSESQVLGLYLADLAERAYATFAPKYGYTPPGPVRVEVYRSHADFSVRTIGLAGLGALGVSFGNTVAFDSPAAKDAGTFTWASTAWHELAHTFTLGASDQRVPRWLSEGLSVYEERRGRRGWGQSVSPAFLEAYKEGRLHPPSRLNDGFVRPSYPRQVIFSYYEASLVCELIARDWGERAFIDMLRSYRAGSSTEQVVRRVLGIDMGTLDKRFDAFMRERFGAALAVLEQYPEMIDSAATLLRVGEEGRDAAIALLRRARDAFPEFAGAESAYPLLARALVERGDRRGAIDVLVSMVQQSEASHDTYVSLADLLAAAGDTARAADALEGAIYVNPFEIADHERLAAFSAALRQNGTLIRERRAVVALNPVDRAEALYQLAVAYRDAGDAANARHAVIQSLEVAPHFERAQELLLALHEGKTP